MCVCGLPPSSLDLLSIYLFSNFHMTTISLRKCDRHPPLCLFSLHLVSSIIITGAGDFFCAGGDLNGLKTRRSMTEHEKYNALGQLNGTIQAIYDCSKPIISAIEGGAAGAGVSLAMACDLVVMSEHTFFSLAPLTL